MSTTPTTPAKSKVGAQNYALGYEDCDRMIDAGLSDIVKRLDMEIPSNMYGIGFRTCLGVHTERLAQ